ncbi:SGNH/GDSL hydrolase family protein [Alicyclobacillus tolerans]|uniref:Lysophospholipase L1-like esterase n=2 Tax=Alicyclobacillus tolerans TaxID=90970 RepID=A0ABT9LVR2_9BACL|nr:MULTISPECIES: SGNH/GDSL hydrolase family protein [Alicyclobacillus]MDP9728355.1 lysophospholipase L1-like esterase [Alicyclobacillus tengchongensis]SHK13337.1 GDSL-like Lipase/Acylhydrolase family protein [Alicyclobacillus montanus]
MSLYIALGDSITAGECASSWSLAYPSLVTSMLSQRRSIWNGEVLAEPGWTSQDLFYYVTNHSPVYLEQAKVVSLWVGGDNLVDAARQILGGAPRSAIHKALVGYSQSLAALLQMIRQISRAQIIVCTQYNPFPNSPIASETIEALNTATLSVASRMQTSVAPCHTWFAGRQAELIYGYRNGKIQDVLTSPIAPVHPNNLGHRVIAQNLVPLVRSQPMG